MMTRRLSSLPAVAILCGAAIFGAATPVDAGLVVTLEQVSGPSGPVAPVMVPVVLTAAGEVASFISSFGDFTLEALTVTSNAALSDPALARLQDISISVRNNNSVGDPAVLRVTVLDDSFTTPGIAGDTLKLTNSLSSSGLVGGSASFTSNLDGVSTTAVSLSGAGQIDNSIFTPRAGSSFSMGNVLTITLAANGFASIDATTTAVVPEPSTVAWVIAGLPMLGLSIWRRRRKAKA